MCGIIGYKGERNQGVSGDNSSNFQKLTDIPSNGSMNILNFIKFEHYYCQIDSLFQEFLRKNTSSYSQIAKKLNISHKTVYRILNKKGYWMNFQTLLDLARVSDIKKKEVFNAIISIKTHNSFPIKFKLGNLESPAFFRIIGHILGDGGIHVIKQEGKFRAFYVNNEQALLDSFQNDVIELFGNFKIYSRKRIEHGDEIWLPSTVGLMIYNLLNYEKYEKQKRVPKFIFGSDEKLICSLLQAVFDDEGSVSVDKYMIIISLGSEKLLKDIYNLFLSIRIRCNPLRKIIPRNRSVMYRFSITSKENILKFSQKINFMHPMKKKRLQILVNKYKGK